MCNIKGHTYRRFTEDCLQYVFIQTSPFPTSEFSQLGSMGIRSTSIYMLGPVFCCSNRVNFALNSVYTCDQNFCRLKWHIVPYFYYRTNVYFKCIPCVCHS